MTSQNQSAPAESKKKTIMAIVKKDAATDFVKFDGKKIGKDQAVEVSKDILKQKRIAKFIETE